MKKRALEIINGLFLVVITSVDILLITKHELTNDCWFIIVLALLCFTVYLVGRIFLHFTVVVIYKLSEILYRKSENISIPTFGEAKKVFKERLPYLLMTVNILMLLLMLTIILT